MLWVNSYQIYSNKETYIYTASFVLMNWLLIYIIFSNSVHAFIACAHAIRQKSSAKNMLAVVMVSWYIDNHCLKWEHK